jgi:hypothetical protein
LIEYLYVCLAVVCPTIANPDFTDGVPTDTTTTSDATAVPGWLRYIQSGSSGNTYLTSGGSAPVSGFAIPTMTGQYAISDEVDTLSFQYYMQNSVSPADSPTWNYDGGSVQQVAIDLFDASSPTFYTDLQAYLFSSDPTIATGPPFLAHILSQDAANASNNQGVRALSVVLPSFPGRSVAIVVRNTNNGGFLQFGTDTFQFVCS